VSSYVYKGKNLTVLVLTKIANTVAIIAKQEHRAFEDSFRDFIQSRTFRNLQNMGTLMWGENAAYIADDYAREQCDNKKERH
jgi:hypothetical protein